MRHVPPPHLPAADLGLTDAELHALLHVTERLEDGRIAAADFDMMRAARCIAGHMGRRTGAVVIDSATRPIARLFHPLFTNGIHHPAWSALPQQAARACRQFLQTGAVDWDAAIAGGA